MSRFLTKILNEPPGGRPQSQTADAHVDSTADAHTEKPKTPAGGRPLLECVDAHKEGSADALASPDDRDLMILFKTHPTIINLYLQYNPENRWRPADDYEGQRYNDRDIRLIEVGIIQTQFNARFKKINSFKYYTTEIDIALETPLTNETIEIMLKQHRRRWQEATGREL